MGDLYGGLCTGVRELQILLKVGVDMGLVRQAGAVRMDGSFSFGTVPACPWTVGRLRLITTLVRGLCIRVLTTVAFLGRRFKSSCQVAIQALAGMDRS